ncbi:MAG: winged helix DNA-binding protein [Candidatus Nanohaloarchaea archaeon]
MEDLESFFLNVKPVKILITLNNPGTDNYASAISKETDCTYSHTVRIIQKLEDGGLVESNMKGRKKEIELTEKGLELAKALSGALHLME